MSKTVPDTACTTWRPAQLGWLAALLLVPLPYSVHLTSFLHAKEWALLALLAGALLAQAWCGSIVVERGALRRLRPLGLAMTYGLWVGGADPDALAQALVVLGCVGWAVVAHPMLRSPAARGRLLGAVSVSGWVVALLAVGQYAGWLDRWFPAAAGYGQPAYSVFGNQDLLGGYLAVCVVASSLRTLYGRRSASTIAGAALLGAALVLSSSRSAWLACALGLALVVVGAVRRKHGGQAILLAITAPLLGGLLAAAADQWLVATRVAGTFSATDTGGWVRVWIWEASGRMVAESFPWGIGWGRFGEESAVALGEALHGPLGKHYPANGLPAQHAHNVPLEWLVELGAVGMLLIAWILRSLWRRRGAEVFPAIATLAVFALFNATVASAPHVFMGALLFTAATPHSEARALHDWRDGTRWAFAGLGVALLVTHTFWVMLPSVALARAETLHVSGTNPARAYDHAARYPLTRAQAQGFAAMYWLDTGHSVQALTAARSALRDRAWPEVEVVRGLALARLGLEHKARALLKRALRQWPTNQAAWDAAWELADAGERERLLRHAEQWHLRGAEAATPPPPAEAFPRR